MEKAIDWIERQALENLRFRLTNAETLAREANATLLILLAGVGGGLAYVAKGMESPALSALTAGAAAFTGWLVLCALMLTAKCILTANLAVPTNEPKNLKPAIGMDLDRAREYELENIQGRIDETKARNWRIARWLDRVRLMAVSSPVVFAIAAWVSVP